MLSLKLDLPRGNRPQLLCVGAHSDDIEIGACATILELAEAYPEMSIVWTVFGAPGERGDEARASAEYCTRGFANAEIRIHAFRDGFFPVELASIKEQLELLKGMCDPDIILTHYREDRHQDHRVISDLTWQTFRNHFILEYEIPKYDGDLGAPNMFVPVSEKQRDNKLSVLERFFGSQRSRSWFTPDTFSALMRLRGIECNSTTGLAEAFYCRKALL